MTHQCSHERAPASAHASAHASVQESAHKSWLSLCYNPIQRLPLECSRECSRGCPRKCTRSGLVVCHLVCFHSEGEKPPKIRKKSSQEQSSWELFGPPPTEKTEKIGKIKGTLVRKVPGNLRSREFVFFLCGFSAPYSPALFLAHLRRRREGDREDNPKILAEAGYDTILP